MTIKANKTPEDLAAENLAKAKKISEERNKSRVEMLNAIADNNDSSPDSGMIDTDGDLVLSDTSGGVLKSADQLASEEAAEAEKRAKELQTEGSGDPVDKAASTEEQVAEKSGLEDDNSRTVDGVIQYKTVVNGKEKWLSLDQLIATSQKVESADEYLQEAKLKTVEKDSSRVEPDKQDTTEEDSIDWKKTLHAAVMGDEEAINKVASALQQRPSEMTPDVVRQIDDRWSFRTAADWFEGEYQDVLGDPRLKKLVYEEDKALAESNPSMPYRQRLKSAGDAIREAVSGWQKSPVKTEPRISPAKIEAKRQLSPVPSAAARQQTNTEDEAEESVSDAISKMAKARGQDRAIIHRSTSR